MANTLYPLGKEGFLDGTIDADTAVFKLLLLRSYTYDAADKFVSDLSGATVVATSGALASKTVTQGVFDAADMSPAWTAVGAGAACNNYVLIQASAVTGGSDVAASAQRLVCFIDTATGLPVTPNGTDINVTFNNGASKIFAL